MPVVSLNTVRVLRVVLSHQPRSSSIRLPLPLLILALCALLFGVATEPPSKALPQPVATTSHRAARWLQQTRSHASNHWLRARRAVSPQSPPHAPSEGTVFLDSLTALLSVLLAIAVAAGLVRLGLRSAQPSSPPLHHTPPPTAAELARLPRCTTRRGVTDAERAEMLHILRDPATARGLALHDGLLALGTAREVLLKPTSAERQRLLRKFERMLSWRRRSGADSVLSDGVPAGLIAAGGQSESWEWGRTRGGLPVFIDQAKSWRAAIAACRRHGVPPSEYGKARMYWHERCLERVRREPHTNQTRRRLRHMPCDCGSRALVRVRAPFATCVQACDCHADGTSANGQFIHVIDMDGLDVSWAELKVKPTSDTRRPHGLARARLLP